MGPGSQPCPAPQPPTVAGNGRSLQFPPPFARGRPSRRMRGIPRLVSPLSVSPLAGQAQLPPSGPCLQLPGLRLPWARMGQWPAPSCHRDLSRTLGVTHPSGTCGYGPGDPSTLPSPSSGLSFPFFPALGESWKSRWVTQRPHSRAGARHDLTHASPPLSPFSLPSPLLSVRSLVTSRETTTLTPLPSLPPSFG